MKKYKIARKVILRILISVGVLVLLYALSIGPAYRFLRKGKMRNETFLSIYAPINKICERSKFVDDVVDWYLLFWYSDAKEMMRSLKEMDSETAHPK